MSNPDDIRDDLSALIDGALDDERRRAVEDALDRDPELWAEYKRLLRVDALYAELPRETAPADFAARVRGAIARREQVADGDGPGASVKIRPFVQQSRRSLFWPLAAAATLMAGFFLYATMGGLTGPHRTMLSMEKSAPAQGAGQTAKDDSLYKVRVMPAEEAKAAAPAAAAIPAEPAPAPAAPAAPVEANEAPAASAETPAPVSEESVKGEAAAQAAASTGVQPLAPAGESQLEGLRQEYRERVRAKMGMAKKGDVGKDAAAAPEGAEAASPAAEPLPAPPPSANAVAEQAGAVPASPVSENAPVASTPSEAPPSTGDQRKVAGRVFLRSDSGWVDQAYRGEVLTPLEAGSDEYKELLPTHPPLAQVAELGGEITLRVDGVWRSLKTGKPVAEQKQPE